LQNWPYSSDDEALNDVLRLSKGMNIVKPHGGLNQGGGKAVIYRTHVKLKPLVLLRAMGRFVLKV